jgi:hypothetical protein
VGNMSQDPVFHNVTFVAGTIVNGFTNSIHGVVRGQAVLTGQARLESTDSREIAYNIWAERSNGSAAVYLNEEILEFSDGYAGGFTSGSPTLRVSYGVDEQETGASLSESGAVIVSGFFTEVPELGASRTNGAAPGFPTGSVPVMPGKTSNSPLAYVGNGADYGVAGEFVTLLPVIGDWGTENPVYVANTQLMPSSSGVAAGYRFEVPADGPLFKTFSIPNTLPNGDGDFVLQFDGVEVGITAGQEVDFTTYFPDGISEFALLGVSAHEPLEFAPPSFAHGFRFTRTGIGIVSVDPIAVPEPSSGTLVLICAGMLAIKRSRVALSTILGSTN